MDMTPEKDSLWECEFVDPLVKIARRSGNVDVRHYSELSGQETEDYDRVIISGSPLGDVRYMENLNKFEWLLETGKPVLGICAGFQVIGVVFGSKLKECREIGPERIRTLKKNTLFEGEFEAYELHNFSVEPSEEFEVLASSKRCVQAIKHKNKEIYGVLFHPEVRNREVLERFLSHSF